jgi:uncharacterized membrane protein
MTAHSFYGCLKTIVMEKRVLGIILTILGAVGLILGAINFVNRGIANSYNARAVAMCGILGLIFFFAGIGIVRSTKDIKKKSEDVV